MSDLAYPIGKFVWDGPTLLAAMHERWVAFLRSLGEAEWKRTFRHPELGVVALEKNLALYAWHGRHHVAHVTALRERMGW